MVSISFENKEFPIREINHPDLGLIYISVNTLNDLLLNEENNYISSEAEVIDEMIYYYVDDDEIKLSEKNLLNLLLLEVL